MNSTTKEHLVNIGFTEDYIPSHNVQLNALDLLEWMTFENTTDHHSDLIWLCNQIARIGQRHSDTLSCRDNFRACRVIDIKNTQSQRYRAAKRRGCCGSFDGIFRNPKTGNSYWIGFNYGH